MMPPLYVPCFLLPFPTLLHIFTLPSQGRPETTALQRAVSELAAAAAASTPPAPDVVISCVDCLRAAESGVDRVWTT